jgi:hypothetical protein
VIIGQKIYFTMPVKKMKNMEFIKAMLAKMNANMKSTLEKNGRHPREDGRQPDKDRSQ